MAEALKVGREKELVWEVTEKRLASSYGNTGVEVFGTPALVEMMEHAAVECVLPCLPEGHGTVGTLVHVEHVASTPVGMRVRCVARLMGMEGRKLRFEMEARTEKEVIGRGVQERVVVELARFVAKARGKAAGS